MHIEINKFQNLKSKDVSVNFSPQFIECKVRGEIDNYLLLFSLLFRLLSYYGQKSD